MDVLTKIFAKRNGQGGYELKELFASYRSTAEITEFCNGILGGEGVGGNTVERHGRCLRRYSVSHWMKLWSS